MKNSIEVRKRAVTLCLSGMLPKEVGKKLRIHAGYVGDWLERYKLYGLEGLDKQPYKHFTFSEKCKIICAYREKSVSLHTICAIHNVSRSRVLLWNKIAEVEGYEGLREIKNRGKPPKIKDMGRPKKREPQTKLEKLQLENEYLRAENAYLKKLRALRIEEEAQKQRSKL